MKAAICLLGLNNGWYTMTCSIISYHLKFEVVTKKLARIMWHSNCLDSLRNSKVGGNLSPGKSLYQTLINLHLQMAYSDTKKQKKKVLNIVMQGYTSSSLYLFKEKSTASQSCIKYEEKRGQTMLSYLKAICMTGM